MQQPDLGNKVQWIKTFSLRSQFILKIAMNFGKEFDYIFPKYLVKAENPGKVFEIHFARFLSSPPR